MPILNLSDQESYDLFELLELVDWSITLDSPFRDPQMMIKRLRNWQMAFWVPTKNKRNWKKMMASYMKEKYDKGK
jgi:hypothetical protein